MSTKVIPLPKKKAKVWERVERNLYLHVPSGIYYARKYRAGKGRIFESTGQRSISAARTAAETIRADFVSDRAPTERRGFRVKDILDDVDRELAKDFEAKERSKRTRDKDKTLLADMRTHFGAVYLSDLDESYWENWIRDTGRGLKRGLGDFAKYLSIILDHAYRKKYVGRKPSFRNPDPKRKTRVVVYTPEQIRLFWKHADPILQDLVILGGENGFRPFENRKLKWEFIEFKKAGRQSIAVVRFPESDFYGKKSKGREIQVGPLSLEVLRRRYQARDKSSPWVFPGIKDKAKPLTDVQVSRLWRSMLEAAGISDEIKFHWLRHTFYTTALLQKRLDISKVSEFGGTSITTLQKHYLKADYVKTADVSQAMDLGISVTRKAKSKRIG